MFNWFDKLLVKIAKKILNKYAPTGEFIAYINEQEEKVLKKLGGYGQPINETGIKSFISLGDIWEGTVNFFQNNKDTIVDVGMGIGKAWVDMNDQERKNAVTEKAYNDYMKQVEAAGKEAESAVALNLTPMQISNVPTSKADVSSFTAVAARGGLMNLPTRHRKRYASQGFVEDDVEIMDPESLGDFELKQEEGVNIGEMAAFPDTGDPMSNAQQVWQSGAIDQGIYQMDFNIFFQSGDWMDYISKEKVQGDMKMASNPDDFMTTDEMQIPQEEIMSMIGAQQAAKGGIIGLRHGGRPGYSIGERVEDQETILETPNKEVIENTDTAFLTGEGTWGIDRAMRIWSILPDDIQGGYGNDFMNFFESTDWHGVNMAQGGRARYADSDWIVKKSDVEEAGAGPMSRAGAGLSPESNTKEFDMNDIIISIDDKNFGTTYGGEPIIVQDIMTGKYKVMGNDGRVVEFDTIEEAETYKKQLAPFAKGGRVKRDNGGIMNLGGLEKDYRTTGGFVPIGAYERKDDVPARLSKNEFVMTADAVRAAGGGSINKGAQRMYDTMKHLEASPTAKRMTA